MQFLQPYLMMIAEGQGITKGRPRSRNMPQSVGLDSTNRKSFIGFTPEILRCIWLLPVTALNLFEYCWPPEPTQTRQRIIGKAAHYTMQRMATSTALIGMREGKYRQSNACSMPEPTLMPRTKMVLTLASRSPHAMCRCCEMPARRR